MKLKKYFKQAYPKVDSKWKTIVLISLFISVFLMVFQPFGISSVGGNLKYLWIVGYGIITFLVLVINMVFIQNIFPFFFAEKNWTIGKEMFWLLWILFTIGLANALYSATIFSSFHLTFRFIISFQLITIGVGIIPIGLIVSIKQNYLLKKHQSAAKNVNASLESVKMAAQTDTEITLHSENKNEDLKLNKSDLFYIESTANYVDVYYLKDQKIQKKTLRSSLKRMAENFTDVEEIVICHRAFMVNLNKVVKVNGNAQGLKLTLSEIDVEIPVSRNKVSLVRKAMNNK